MVESDIKKLEEQSLFYNIAPEEIKHMMGCLGAYVKEYKKSEFISITEEPVKCVGIVLTGRVHMVKEDMWGNRAILAVMKELEVFGETFACGSNTISTVSFQAVEDSKVLFLNFEDMIHTCAKVCAYHQKLVENMVTLIADKNVQLMEKIEITSKKTIREKVAAYLTNQSLRADSKYFTIPLGRIELAEYLCSDRSALTRELSLMRKQGYIDYEKNTFRILKELS